MHIGHDTAYCIDNEKLREQAISKKYNERKAC